MIGHDFPYLDTRDLNLDWLLKNMKQLLRDWATYQQTMNQNFANLQAAVDQFETDITTAFDSLHDYVEDYFDNLDVQQEINNKLNAMKISGELAEIMNPLVATQTSAWLAEHITNPSNPPVDTSLSVSGAAADAKVTGDKITALKNQLEIVAPVTDNLLDILLMPEFSENGVTASRVNDTLVYNGTASAQFTERSRQLPLQAGQTYTARIYTGTSQTISGYIISFDASNQTLQVVNTNATNTDYTFTVNASATRVFWNIGAPANGSYSNVAMKYAIVAGSSIGEYTPHQIANDIIARGDIAETESELAELKSMVIDLNEIKTSDMLTGKIYGIDSSGKWTLTDSGGAYYIDPLDLSDYIGGKVRIYLDVLNTGGTRIFGFADEDHYLVSYWRERDTSIFTQGDDGRYYATLPVNARYLVFSYTNYTGGIATNPVIDYYKSAFELQEIAYVDGTSGSDTNAGTAALPFATITKAISSGAKRILVKAGTYSEMIRLVGLSYDIDIALWDMPNYSSSVHVLPKIVIDGGSGRSINYGIYAENCQGVSLSDVVCTRVAYAPFYFKNTQFIRCFHCEASDNANEGMGFQLVNVNGEFVDCYAHNVAKDGFNIHGYGNTDFINCVAHDCGDDGISHHEGCTGHITGGEYYNCAKGGVASPTYGAEVDISGVYSHNNKYGVYAVADDNLTITCKSRISNSVFKDNTDYDLYLSKGRYVGWNNVYDTKQVFANATFTEF